MMGHFHRPKDFLAWAAGVNFKAMSVSQGAALPNRQAVESFRFGVRRLVAAFADKSKQRKKRRQVAALQSDVVHGAGPGVDPPTALPLRPISSNFCFSF